jgi:hypothetical protein
MVDVDDDRCRQRSLRHLAARHRRRRVEHDDNDIDIGGDGDVVESVPSGDSPASTVAATVIVGSGGGPAALGHAEVIAQGVVTFPDGTFVWDAQHLDGAALPYAFTDSPPMFLVAGDPDGIVVQGSGGLLAVLYPGEGSYVPAGATGTAIPITSAATASAERITFVGGSGIDTFTPGASQRDVNGGDLVDAAGTAGTNAAGTAATLGTTVTLGSDGSTPAVVIAGVLGASLT